MMTFSSGGLADARLAGPLPFTKGTKVMQVPVIERSPMFDCQGPGALLEDETRLYHLAADPGQTKRDRLMPANHAPRDAVASLGMTPPRCAGRAAEPQVGALSGRAIPA